MDRTNIALRRKNIRRNSANSNRRAAAALIAASAGLAMFSAADSAFGATYVFSSAGGDWQTPANWSPLGPPIAGDVAVIPSGSTVDSTITDGAMSVGAIIDNANGTLRTLSNADLTNPSQLTLTGTTAAQPLIQLTTGSATSYTIAGYNGSSTGTLNLVLGASGQFQTAVNGTLSISANISETGGSQGFTKTGFGTLSISGSNSYTGATDVHRGNLLLDFTSNTGPKLSSTGSLIFEGASLFMQGNASQAVTQAVGDTYINAAQNTISVTSNGQNTILNAGNFHRSVGAYANINYTPNSGTLAVTTSTANNTFGIIGGWLTVGNNDWASNLSGFVVPLTSAGGYSTTDAVNSWTADTNVTNDTSPYTGTQANNFSIASLRFNDNAAASTVTMAPGKTLTIDTGGILIAGSTAATDSITGGSLTSGVDEIIATTGSSKTLKINSVVADRSGSGTGLSITKNGSGTLQLLGANTNTGSIYVNTGTLVANTIAATGTPSSLGESGTIYLGSTDTVATPVRLIYSGGNTSSDRPWVIGEGGGAFNILTGNTTLTLTGPISGTGSITVNNTVSSGVASTLAIQGANTFTGMTYLTTGAISVDTLAPVGQNSSIGTGLSGGTIVLGDGAAGTLTYTGSANANTDRLLQLGSANAGGSINLIETNSSATLTWNGTMQFASGTPSLINGSSITFSVGPANVRPFQLNAAGTLIFAGNIGNGTLSYGQLQKTGTGTVILTGNNSYQIGTTVNAGTLITATNFSNGTITNVGTTQVMGLSILSGYAQVQAKPVADTPSGFTLIPSINIASSSQLDLTNNGLDIYNPSPTFSVPNQIFGYLKNGYNGGAWTGMGGIISSAAAAASTTTTKTALGYAVGSELSSSTFGGHTIGSQDVVVAYVLQGDANMDGTVNALDFNALATNFGQSADWTRGDFDYSQVVDSSDFSLLAANYGKSLPTSSAVASDAVGLGALVPEPATIALLGLIGGMITMRRRSR